MSWPRFLADGGSACYVWGSYGLTLLAIGGEMLLLRRRMARRHHTHDGSASDNP
jgi:heme exporter protein D